MGPRGLVNGSSLHGVLLFTHLLGFSSHWGIPSHSAFGASLHTGLLFTQLLGFSSHRGFSSHMAMAILCPLGQKTGKTENSQKSVF